MQINLNDQRDIAQKVYKGDQPFLYGIHHRNLIYWVIKFRQDIQDGNLVIVLIRIAKEYSHPVWKEEQYFLYATTVEKNTLLLSFIEKFQMIIYL